MAGLAPLVTLAALWALYLSLTVAGQTFLSFQWDVLLLETGLLAVLYAPWGWRPRRRRRHAAGRGPLGALGPALQADVALRGHQAGLG